MKVKYRSEMKSFFPKGCEHYGKIVDITFKSFIPSASYMGQ